MAAGYLLLPFIGGRLALEGNPLVFPVALEHTGACAQGYAQL